MTMILHLAPVHIWSVVVATVASFAVSSLWYSPILFGREWMRLRGTSVNELDDAVNLGIWKRYVGQLISNLVLFTALGFFIFDTGSATAGDGMLVALIVWIGFSVTTAVGDMLWNKTPLKLALINEICTLVSLIVGGAIIGGWR